MKKIIIFFSSFLLLFCGISLAWIEAKFSRINFDEVMIALNSGIHHSDVGYIYSFVNHAIISPIVISLIILLLFIKFRSRIILAVSFSIMIVYLVIQLLKIDKGSLFSKPSDFYEKEYVFPKNAGIKFGQKHNVLMIALESIESNYQNSRYFGSKGLIPNIESLKKNNSSFSNYIEYDGMTFTIGAIMGMLAGVPLVYNGSSRTIKAMNATGIGNILLDNGYATYSFFSSSGEYTNKEKTLRNKGFQNIIGGDEIKKGDADERVFSGNYFGGTDDTTMFDFAKEKIKKIDKDKPYFIFMETINTHADGYHVKYCKEKGFKQRNFEDVVRCEDKIVADFIDWFRKFDKTAVIILVNDHKTKNAKMNQKLAKLKQRSLYNVFIGTDIFRGAKLDRKIFAPDFFPTIVEAAGGVIPGCRLGLGTSLSKRCEGMKTLREKYNSSDLQMLIKSKNKLYNNLMGSY